MVKTIISKNNLEYQLIILGIELAHKILGLEDCVEELANNSHVIKACEAAKKWNEKFYEFVVSSKPTSQRND